MTNKPRLLDDLAGLAGGAFSAAVGVREEIHAIIQTQINEMLHNLNVVRKDDFDVLRAMVVKARTQQEENQKKLQAMQAEISQLKEKLEKATDHNR